MMLLQKWRHFSQNSFGY